jgi:hypothetical protein
VHTLCLERNSCTLSWSPNTIWRYCQSQLYRPADFVLVQYLVTNNAAPCKSLFHFEVNIVKVSRLWWSQIWNDPSVLNLGGTRVESRPRYRLFWHAYAVIPRFSIHRAG